MKRRIFCLFASGLLLLTGCRARITPSETTVYAMDTIMELTIYGGSNAARDAAAQIRALEAELSVTDPNSEIAAINRDGHGTLSDDAAALLSRALSLCEETGGALDISIYPVLRAWGFTTEQHHVPSQAELDALLPLVDYRRISLSGSEITLVDGMQIDLGSVAKGYLGDLLCTQLRAQGVSAALLNLGGNVQTLGVKPDGSRWHIAVQDPNRSGGYLGVLEIGEAAVVTSGGYERYFEQDGKVYWHVLDPKTGRPAQNGLRSVTVIGADGTTCDAFSTALFVMGTDRAIAFWREHGGFEAIFLTDSDELLVTEGIADRFTPSKDGAGRTLTVISHD